MQGIIEAYRELFRQGHLKSRQENQEVILELRMQISGDILNFIHVRKKKDISFEEVQEFLSDKEYLQTMAGKARQELEEKIQAILKVPRLLIRGFDIIIVLVTLGSAIRIVVNDGGQLADFWTMVNEWKTYITGFLILASRIYLYFFPWKPVQWGFQIVHFFLKNYHTFFKPKSWSGELTT